MLTGQNGILNRAVEAREKTEEANRDEQRKLAQAEALMSTGKTTYKGVTLPEGFAPTKIVGEDSIDDGLVITDGYGNEYVWVEVPKTTEVYPTAGLGITNFTDDEYTKIEDDLHTYTRVYRNGTSYNDTYASDTTSGWFENNSAYNTAKKKMLKSVYQNGGFWVGRYEAGIEVNRTASGTASTIPLSKENLYPYTYVTRTQAKVLAEKVESGSYTSSLLFGVQWDLVLKYIEEKNVAKMNENKDEARTKIEKTLNNDSTTIGNFYNSEFTLNRGKFAQYGAMSDWKDYNSEEKTDLVTGGQKKTQNLQEKGILLTTGATEATNLQNIYDIAGNVWEFIFENTFNSAVPCVSRGGDYGISGSSFQASSRRSYNIASSVNYIGFRISLY